jgi:hypothetical protein
MKTSQVLVVCLSLFIGYIAATALNRPSEEWIRCRHHRRRTGKAPKRGTKSF